MENTLSLILKIMGYIVGAIGLYFGVVEGILESMQAGHHFGEGNKLYLAGGFTVLLIGLMAVVITQIHDRVSSTKQGL